MKSSSKNKNHRPSKLPITHHSSLKNQIIDELEATLSKLKEEAAIHDFDSYTLIRPYRMNDLSEVIKDLVFKEVLSSGKIYINGRLNSNCRLLYTIVAFLYDDGYFVECDQNWIKVSETRAVKFMEQLLGKCSNLSYYWHCKNVKYHDFITREALINKFPILGINSRKHNPSKNPNSSKS